MRSECSKINLERHEKLKFSWGACLHISGIRWWAQSASLTTIVHHVLSPPTTKHLFMPLCSYDDESSHLQMNKLGMSSLRYLIFVHGLLTASLTVCTKGHVFGSWARKEKSVIILLCHVMCCHRKRCAVIVKFFTCMCFLLINSLL